VKLFRSMKYSPNFVVAVARYSIERCFVSCCSCWMKNESVSSVDSRLGGTWKANASTVRANGSGVWGPSSIGSVQLPNTSM